MDFDGESCIVSSVDSADDSAIASAPTFLSRCGICVVRGIGPTLESVAHDLGMSARTLQRRLAEAGITFQQILEETRRKLAKHYLKQSTVELNDAAFLLGFKDANSFFRRSKNGKALPRENGGPESRMDDASALPAAAAGS